MPNLVLWSTLFAPHGHNGPSPPIDHAAIAPHQLLSVWVQVALLLQAPPIFHSEHRRAIRVARVCDSRHAEEGLLAQ